MSDSFSLYEKVALAHDTDGFQVGDIATITDFVIDSSGESGCVLEVFNAVGESLDVIAVSLSDIEKIRADEILSVRSLTNLAGVSS